MEWLAITTPLFKYQDLICLADQQQASFSHCNSQSLQCLSLSLSVLRTLLKWRKSAQLDKKGLWIMNSIFPFLFCCQNAILCCFFVLNVGCQQSENRLHTTWWTCKCFRFHTIIYHRVKHYLWQPPKLNLKAVPSLHRAGTISQTQREQDGWLHWHIVKARLAILGNRFSLLCDSHSFSSSVTTPANHSWGNVQGLWQYLLTLKPHWLHHKTSSDTK